jgi:hypothetical protein
MDKNKLQTKHKKDYGDPAAYGEETAAVGGKHLISIDAKKPRDALELSTEVDFKSSFLPLKTLKTPLILA